MATDTFRLPESSYEEIVKIILAYGSFPREAGASEIAQAAVMNDTIISRNNAFLLGIGILQEGAARRKSLTEQGRDLARALGHEMPDEIRRFWRIVVASSDFLQKMLSAVRIRKGMERSSLQSHIAYSAGLPKSSRTLTGAATVIDVLRAAELLIEQEDRLVAITPEEESSLLPPDTILHPSAHASPDANAAPPDHDAGIAPNNDSLANHVNIDLKISVVIECSSEEIESLGARIRIMIDDIVSKNSSGNSDSK